MPNATQQLELKFPVEVTLKIKSVTPDWIEGTLELTLFGGHHNQDFKLQNNVEKDFDIPTPIGDVKLHIKVYLENPKRACAEGYVEKIAKVPFHVCDNF